LKVESTELERIIYELDLMTETIPDTYNYHLLEYQGIDFKENVKALKNMLL
jgi:hypothetical protein